MSKVLASATRAAVGSDGRPNGTCQSYGEQRGKSLSKLSASDLVRASRGNGGFLTAKRSSVSFDSNNSGDSVVGGRSEQQSQKAISHPPQESSSPRSASILCSGVRNGGDSTRRTIGTAQIASSAGSTRVRAVGSSSQPLLRTIKTLGVVDAAAAAAAIMHTPLAMAGGAVTSEAHVDHGAPATIGGEARDTVSVSAVVDGEELSLADAPTPLKKAGGLEAAPPPPTAPTQSCSQSQPLRLGDRLYQAVQPEAGQVSHSAAEGITNPSSSATTPRAMPPNVVYDSVLLARRRLCLNSVSQEPEGSQQPSVNPDTSSIGPSRNIDHSPATPPMGTPRRTGSLRNSILRTGVVSHSARSASPAAVDSWGLSDTPMRSWLKISTPRATPRATAVLQRHGISEPVRSHVASGEVPVTSTSVLRAVRRVSVERRKCDNGLAALASVASAYRTQSPTVSDASAGSTALDRWRQRQQRAEEDSLLSITDEPTTALERWRQKNGISTPRQQRGGSGAGTPLRCSPVPWRTITNTVNISPVQSLTPSRQVTPISTPRVAHPSAVDAAKWWMPHGNGGGSSLTSTSMSPTRSPGRARPVVSVSPRVRETLEASEEWVDPQDDDDEPPVKVVGVMDGGSSGSAAESEKPMAVVTALPPASADDSTSVIPPSAVAEAQRRQALRVASQAEGTKGILERVRGPVLLLSREQKPASTQESSAKGVMVENPMKATDLVPATKIVRAAATSVAAPSHVDVVAPPGVTTPVQRHSVPLSSTRRSLWNRENVTPATPLADSPSVVSAPSVAPAQDSVEGSAIRSAVERRSDRLTAMRQAARVLKPSAENTTVAAPRVSVEEVLVADGEKSATPALVPSSNEPCAAIKDSVDPSVLPSATSERSGECLSAQNNGTKDTPSPEADMYARDSECHREAVKPDASGAALAEINPEQKPVASAAEDELGTDAPWGLSLDTLFSRSGTRVPLARSWMTPRRSTSRPTISAMAESEAQPQVFNSATSPTMPSESPLKMESALASGDTARLAPQAESGDELGQPGSSVPQRSALTPSSGPRKGLSSEAARYSTVSPSRERVNQLLVSLDLEPIQWGRGEENYPSQERNGEGLSMTPPGWTPTYQSWKSILSTSALAPGILKPSSRQATPEQSVCPNPSSVATPKRRKTVTFNLMSGCPA